MKIFEGNNRLSSTDVEDIKEKTRKFIFWVRMRWLLYHYLSNWNDTYKILPRSNYDRDQIKKWENDKSVVIIGSYPEFTVEDYL